ncbi:GumC domain-containing protein [Mesoterricola silvestris]|uniref:hypothetical protein n=1 Tax=Mesoterricola silvestris TaxID=2927979 RepID=UPI00292D26A1|nr:hypothetical protein [Mesoterricola silvestris]
MPAKAALVTMVAVALLTLTVPNSYTSQARILPAESKVAGGGLGALAAAVNAAGFSVPGEGSDANFVEILQSRTLLQQLLETRFNFHEARFMFQTAGPKEMTLQEYLGEKNLDRALKRVRKTLAADRDLKSKILVITVETHSPDLSQAVAARSLEILGRFVLEKNQTRGGLKAAYLAGRLVDAEKETNAAQTAMEQFLSTNRNWSSSPDPYVRLHGAKLEGELKFRQQMLYSLAMNREQALLEEKNDLPIVNVMDKPNLPVLKSGPARSLFTLAAGILVFLSMWGWRSRSELIAFLKSNKNLI